VTPGVRASLGAGIRIDATLAAVEPQLRQSSTIAFRRAGPRRGHDLLLYDRAQPLFDGGLVADHATVVAIGSHERDARETDDTLAARATVVVESRTSALREAGDVILAIDSGATTADQLVTLAELIRGEAKPPAARPRFFKSTGMPWEDAVVAAHLTDTRSLP